MKCVLALERVCGRKDRTPRRFKGDLGIHICQRNGRSIRVANLTDATLPSPTLASLFEPIVLHWIAQDLVLQGYEENDGQWTLQIWRCRVG